MNRFLVAIALTGSALLGGCQSSGPPLGRIPEWRFPCNYRAFDAGFCNNLNGLPDANFNLSSRLMGQ